MNRPGSVGQPRCPADPGRFNLAGALKGYADGRPHGGPAAEDAWQIGVDPAAVSATAGSYAVLAYARDAARVGADVAAYRRVCGPIARLRTLLRPGMPDTTSAAHLAGKVAAAGAAGADAIDFYAYGLTPLPALDRITASLQGAASA